MKRLVLVIGPNGTGKSTACKALIEHLPMSAYIDSDYCRYMNPFSFTSEEIDVVVSNITTIMINYFRLSTIKNIIFPYGFHGVRKQIFDRILNRLDESNISYALCPILLECSLEENISRMQKDGRDAERILSAIQKTREIYHQYNYPRLDTTYLTPEETAEAMVRILDLLKE